METIDNKVVFKSGLEMTSKQYRGQVEDFGICKASLFRNLKIQNLDNQYMFKTRRII